VVIATRNTSSYVRYMSLHIVHAELQRFPSCKPWPEIFIAVIVLSFSVLLNYICKARIHHKESLKKVNYIKVNMKISEAWDIAINTFGKVTIDPTPLELFFLL
jgi:hypothetical protein